ncbi:hypothetical protein EON62_00900, partial [archaeon]
MLICRIVIHLPSFYHVAAVPASLCIPPHLLPPVQDAAEQMEKLTTSLEEFMRSRYSEWMAYIADIDQVKIVEYLQTPLLARCASPVPSLEASESAAALASTAKPGAARARGAANAPPPPYIRSNFDKRMLSVLSEVHYWEKFEGKFLIPFYTSDLLHAHGENLRILREYVLQTCHEYNTIISSLDDVEMRLFSDVVRRLDRKLAPG